jgi:hypothetical protein
VSGGFVRVIAGPFSGRMSDAAPEFADFMRPDVDWIVPAEYAAAFDGLIVEEELEQMRFERACERELYGDDDG